MGDDLKSHKDFFYNKNVSNNIAKFYENKKIFITGASGFVGKALLEKLLRSCNKIEAIFIMMRSKKGISVDQRHKELLNNSVFNRIKENDPNIFEKVKIISGDMELPNLGLTEADQKFLIENIDIVFHSAATVRFNENLKTAITLNALGTKKLLELCLKMQNLKAFIHVSTAFSNADKKIIEEKVYKPIYDVNFVISLLESFSDEIFDNLSSKLMGNHPNTYTYAKALAEQLVQQYSKYFPAAIVRPSIITAAWKEPYPGWVDNLSGITGIVLECGRGTVKSIICNENCRMDLIPVDIVVNTLITSVWHISGNTDDNNNNCTDLKIFNCTSGVLNPITWKEFAKYTHNESYKWPSKYITWYPQFKYTTSRMVHLFYTTFYHNFPAMILDMFLICSGRKPMMLKLSSRLNQALEVGSFFSTNEWKFESNSYESLIKAINDSEDGENFLVDLPLNRFNWENYVGVFLKGIREFILKDSLNSLPDARKKLNKLYWFKKILQCIPYVVFLAAIRQTSRGTIFM